MTSHTRTGRRLDELAAEAASCQACDLYARATQTVFGDGPAASAIAQPITDEPDR